MVLIYNNTIQNKKKIFNYNNDNTKNGNISIPRFMNNSENIERNDISFTNNNNDLNNHQKININNYNFHENNNSNNNIISSNYKIYNNIKYKPINNYNYKHLYNTITQTKKKIYY